MTISAQTKDQLSAAIEAAWESRATLAPNNAPSDIRDAVAAITGLPINGSRMRYC